MTPDNGKRLINLAILLGIIDQEQSKKLEAVCQFYDQIFNDLAECRQLNSVLANRVESLEIEASEIVRLCDNTSNN